MSVRVAKRRKVCLACLTPFSTDRYNGQRSDFCSIECATRGRLKLCQCTGWHPVDEESGTCDLCGKRVA